MIKEPEKVQDIINNPSLSFDEAKEKLALMDDEFEDIAEYVTIFLGDKRYFNKTAKHRGVTKRKLK